MEIMIKIIFLMNLVSFMCYAQSSVVTHSPIDKMQFYPCSSCHQPSSLSAMTLKPRTSRKSLGIHEDIEFKHMPEVMDCFMCHGHKNPDTLVLLDGQTIQYEEVPLLCGQCHGLKKGEWDQGLHGRLEGSWKNQKIKPICTDCHKAHMPKFPKLKAFPPPKVPKFGRKKGEH
ncbi:MAG: hypothetical protein A2Z91_01510 [Deltaproteobacteria bacterium GWA2_38_16]|nr:MAG: hypothetical protein A2Z91_01510 [Deltaproteobacteria bacterium GWA2_38_16]OGQ03310.1 MAG: hypothetical protein A3D19_00175 [Deltaproteobacteria bacterium RIFCSPHIGHO2_02_FULL_38_15]OGQ30473.1 MAG: hypothetical protein A3A72_08780 [Deltaproteobacteria bacterium RIFCSPLOWO2_01_FULL_38_9]OGQ63182.1 MAG: hypothetical protein A3G92_03805 [Deltaproteobacteria bacterium RIFCSPLOWO2_12_FULL_38_8]HBQ22019.1 hypothetical protein [Deltaproteobacteria bacterium]